MTRILRALALAIAVAGFVDPAVPVQRPSPIDVQVRSDGSPAAGLVRDRLAAELPPHVRLGSMPGSAAVVVIGDRIAPDDLATQVPISIVLPGGPPNVRVEAAGRPPVLVAGQSVSLAATVRGAGVAGRRTTAVLAQAGVELGRVDHDWTGDGPVEIDMPYVPPAAGRHVVRIAAIPLDGETRVDDNAVDLVVQVEDRALRILVHETRPTWAAGFVRRALESDPVFSVASTQRSSQGISTRAGDPPRRLAAGDLEPFDAVVVGAPEDLAARDVAALEAFASVRGGAVIVLPDRVPSGPYVSLLPRGFREVLLDRPVRLVAPAGPSFRASELAVAREPGPAAVPLAALEDGTPIVAWWPMGEGRLVYSGALDGWRFRGLDDDGFARFWRQAIAGAALAAPGRVALSLEPAVAAPLATVRLTARVRKTELRTGADGSIAVPAIGAEAIGPDGRRRMIRMWPAPEPGTFEGEFTPSHPGRHTVRVHLENGAAVEQALPVAADASRHGTADLETLRLAAHATGGVVAHGTGLGPLIDHLRGLARGRTTIPIHPMRSAWWILPFTLALCGEWAIRRARGLR